MNKVICKTNIEHDKQLFLVGTVIDKWPGTEEQLDQLRLAGAVEDYSAPAEAQQEDERSKPAATDKDDDKPISGRSRGKSGKSAG